MTDMNLETLEKKANGILGLGMFLILFWFIIAIYVKYIAFLFSASIGFSILWILFFIISIFIAVKGYLLRGIWRNNQLEYRSILTESKYEALSREKIVWN